jgi:lycopene cyclase domain-containing protein
VSYTVAAGLGMLGALLLDLAVLRTRLVTRKVWWASYPIVLVAQLISNGVLTGRQIVRYNSHAVLGLRIGYAPVEDLAFGFALVLTAVSVWVWLGDRGIDGPPRSPAR